MIAQTLRLIPRSAVSGYLRALRLPLTAVERVSGQAGNESWPAGLAFEGFEAGVESVLGSLLRDEVLAERGRLRQAKVAKLREAIELETVAEREREEARQEQQQRKAQVADERKRTLQVAKQREQEAERQTQAKKQQVQSAAAKKKAAAQSAKAAQDKAVDRRERAERTEALDAEAKALEIVKDALEAEETVDVIDATIEGNKEARKTG